MPQQECEPEIPGTFVFDGLRSRAGLPLNNMAKALTSEENRAQYVADPEAFMERFGLTEQQRDAVRNRDYLRMLELGGNIYFTYKIGMIDGLTVPDIVAQMTGQTAEEFKQMMKDGGRKPLG
ncbi:protocatechuate 3,4-dioxygenase [bacterium RCC_150]